MRTGFDAVNKASSEAKARANQGFSGRLNYFSPKDGETKILRFLTDEVLAVQFYQYVPNNQGKFTDFIVAPDLHSDDPSWHGEDWVKKYGGYQLENGMSGPRVPLKGKTRVVGVAVMREEVPREAGGKAITYQDYLHEINVGGQEYPARWFGVVNQTLALFWDFMSAYHEEFGTICDRDYKIKRTGASLDTSYSIIPLAPDPDFDIKALQKAYGYGRTIDPATIKDDPERFLYCPQTLGQWAEDYASEERAKYWLDDPKAEAAAARASNGGYTASGNDEFARATTSNPQREADEAQAAPPPATDFSSLRARLEKHNT